MGNVQAAEARRLLDICLAAGVNLIDTADIYSFGRSEEVIGEALGDQRKDWILATKVFNRLGPGSNQAGLSRRHIIEACEASLRRLRTDYLDLYQSHSFDALTPLDETLRAYDDLIRAGKVRYIGCSNYSGWHLMKSCWLSDRHHLPRYISQQINYSLLARDAEHELIPAGLDQRIGVMAWSPLQAGLLSGKFRRGGAKPEESRLNTLDLRPGGLRAPLLHRGRAGRDRRTPRGLRCAGGPELGDAETGRRYGDHRGTQRKATARQPRRGGVAAGSGRGSPAGRGIGPAPALPQLASAEVRDRTEPSTAVCALRIRLFPPPLEQDDAGRNADIERGDLPRHGDAQEEIAALANQIVQPVSFPS